MECLLPLIYTLRARRNHFVKNRMQSPFTSYCQRRPTQTGLCRSIRRSRESQATRNACACACADMCASGSIQRPSNHSLTPLSHCDQSGFVMRRLQLYGTGCRQSISSVVSHCWESVCVCVCVCFHGQFTQCVGKSHKNMTSQAVFCSRNIRIDLG